MHWDNVKLSYHARYVRSCVINIATFFLVLFWTIPVALVASLTTVDNLTKVFPFMESVVESSPAVRGLSLLSKGYLNPPPPRIRIQ